MIFYQKWKLELLIIRAFLVIKIFSFSAAPPKIEMESVFDEQILADKLSKLNNTQQCIESILSKLKFLFVFDLMELSGSLIIGSIDWNLSSAVSLVHLSPEEGGISRQNMGKTLP